MYPLKERTAPLGRDGVALHGVRVAVRRLHVGENVRGGLVGHRNSKYSANFEKNRSKIQITDFVECFHFGGSAVGKLNVAEVPLGPVDVLRGGH